MAKPKVLVTRRVPQECLDLLKPHFEIEHYNKQTAIPRKLLLKSVKDKDGLLCLLTDKIDSELLAAAPRLKAVSTFSVGYDHIDVPACKARGVCVTNTPGVLTESTADFTWALLMAAARRVVEGDACMRGGKYKGWDPLMLLGTDVFGKTLGVIGFGRIGQAVAKRAAGFSMRVLYYDTRRAAPALESALNAKFVPLDDLLRESDYVSVHTVLDAGTRHLLDDRAFSLMKKSAYLINAARGPIVDEGALVRALKSDKIRGAGLDVYEREPKMAPGLASCKNAVLAPHLASATLETRMRMGVMAASGLIDGLVCKARSPYSVDA
ncbi:MAG: D-glycerate dehydrogenase [Elusimicrobia bacterium]|nr:D-glycerate dehydrogenase [Elusimicrobiota bacterium]